MRYIKKPIEVDAFRFGIDKKPHWMHENNNYSIHPDGVCIIIHTQHGDIVTYPGEYIAKYPDGNISTFEAEIFEATHAKALTS